MKILILFVCIVFVGCGGAYEAEYQEDWEIDAELCEAQDGQVQMLHVSNLETGESYLEVNCEFPKQGELAQCKPDNGLGHECPEI